MVDRENLHPQKLALYSINFISMGHFETNTESIYNTQLTLCVLSTSAFVKYNPTQSPDVGKDDERRRKVWTMLQFHHEEIPLVLPDLERVLLHVGIY